MKPPREKQTLSWAAGLYSDGPYCFQRRQQSLLLAIGVERYDAVNYRSLDHVDFAAIYRHRDCGDDDDAENDLLDERVDCGEIHAVL